MRHLATPPGSVELDEMVEEAQGKIRRYGDNALDRIQIWCLFREDTKALVNTGNGLGLMGRGIDCNLKKRTRETLKPTRMPVSRSKFSRAECLSSGCGVYVQPAIRSSTPTKRHSRGKSRWPILRRDTWHWPIPSEIRFIVHCDSPPWAAAWVVGLEPGPGQNRAWRHWMKIRVVVFEPHRRMPKRKTCSNHLSPK